MEDLVQPTSLVRVAESLRSGETDPRELAARTLDRIAAVDGTVQAFVPEPGRAERLDAAARELVARGEELAERPPLYGVPVGVKDIVHVAGLPTAAGSQLPPEELAGPQAAVIDRLEKAGAIIAGKTVTGEFAVTAPGPTRNPHRTDHTPGGTSSGSAAAVAAGLVPLAIGTQTIGSLIRPAAYCGVVGFKPTHGRIPLDGVLPVAPTFDTVGVIAATVADATLAASCLVDDWKPAPTESGRPVLGVPEGPYLSFAEPEAQAAYEQQLTALETAGYDIVRVPMFANLEEEAFPLFIINLYELSRAHADLFERFGELYDERTADAIRQGRPAEDSDHAKALQQREDFRDSIAATTDAHGIDLWVTPAATGPAPAGLDNPGESVMSLPWSGAGLPCLTIPTARPQGELPLGLQCVGRTGEDERLLGWATELERVLSA
ncbi:Amidase [Streptomyces davaonensis JCM 4913]|uniref:Amidase n=1 Tax=Streptomyces davaonensis (strain DSM 101723 / JCM 4913 / KCC S-0913 / 768) TaxID=1214101 RepID=K4R2D8_STRDJ|nr:amidase [Streptomyces davaonensis]CCK30436.1 Amidase [Streptomyces davaonensis JCM 4913]